MDIGIYIYDEMHELYVLEVQIEMSVYAPCRCLIFHAWIMFCSCLILISAENIHTHFNPQLIDEIHVFHHN